MTNKIAFLLISLILIIPAISAVPSATLTPDVTSGSAPLTVTFGGGCSDDNNSTPIVSCTIDLDDGSVLDFNLLLGGVHIYHNAGTYNVNLTALNSVAGIANAAATITVSAAANQVPNAQLQASPLSGNAPLTVTFTGSCTDPDGNADIASCKINFEDGNSDINFTDDMTHTYFEPGTYNPFLTATDQQSATDIDSIDPPIIVSVAANQAPVASSVQIAPTSPTTSNSLTCNYIYEDNEDNPEGDTTFRWYEDGAEEAGETEQTLLSSQTLSGENWKCQVTPVALTGTITGTAVDSDPVTIGSIGRPTISSSTHVENAWENDDDPAFTWSTVSGATYYYVFDASSSTTPDSDDDSTSGTSESFSNVSNGSHWFHIRAKVGSEWSSTDHYKIKIDDEKPDRPEDLDASYDEDDDEVTLTWDASGDSYSGIDYYEVYRGSTSDFDDMVKKATNTSRTYIEDDLVDGRRYYYRVRAKDKAGNFSEESAYASMVFGEETETVKPTVQWIDPDNEEIVGGIVEMKVEAEADSTTTIKRVRFFLDGSYIADGTKEGSYHVFDWNTLAVEDGSHKLEATAIDWYGTTGDKFAIDVTVSKAEDTAAEEDAETVIDAADDAKEEAGAIFEELNLFGISPSSEATVLLSDASGLLDEAVSLFDEESYGEAEGKASEAEEKFNQLVNMVSVEDYSQEANYLFNPEHLDLQLQEIGFGQELRQEAAEMAEDYSVERSLSMKKIEDGKNTYYKAVLTIVVSNDSDETKQIKVIEVIPKELVENASDIGGEGITVIVVDPVLQWSLSLEPWEQGEISYRLKDRLTQQEADDLLVSNSLDKFVVPPLILKESTQISEESFSGGITTGLFGLGGVVEVLGWVLLAAIVIAAALLAFSYLRNRGQGETPFGLDSAIKRTGFSGGFFGGIRRREEEPRKPKWAYKD